MIKGGHLDRPDATDVLYSKGKFLEMSAPRIPDRGHGGGCTLSAYLAGHLATGSDIWSAALRSKSDILLAIKGSYMIGHGRSVIAPLEPLFVKGRRYQAMEDLKSAAHQVCDMVPPERVPEDGIDMAYLSIGNGGEEEFCVLDGKIVNVGGRAFYGGGTIFDGGRKIIDVLKGRRKEQPGLRAAACFRSVPVDLGTSLEILERGTDEEHVKPGIVPVRSMRESIKASGLVSNISQDKACIENDHMLWIFGKNPEEITLRLRDLLG